MASDFGKRTADQYRKIREGIENLPVIDPNSASSTSGAVDRQIKEQVAGDLYPVLDKLIEKHDPKHY